MPRKYKNRSGPRLMGKKKELFLKHVAEKAPMSDFYALGFKNKRQVTNKIRGIQHRDGNLTGTAIEFHKPTSSQHMLDTIVTQRAIEILEVMLGDLKSNVSEK